MLKMCSKVRGMMPCSSGVLPPAMVCVLPVPVCAQHAQHAARERRAGTASPCTPLLLPSADFGCAMGCGPSLALRAFPLPRRACAAGAPQEGRRAHLAVRKDGACEAGQARQGRARAASRGSLVGARNRGEPTLPWRALALPEPSHVHHGPLCCCSPLKTDITLSTMGWAVKAYTCGTQHEHTERVRIPARARGCCDAHARFPLWPSPLLAPPCRQTPHRT